MAFIVILLVSTGIGLLVNKDIATNDFHTESSMSDTKNSVIDMEMKTKVTGTEITVNTTFINGENVVASTSLYVISTDTPNASLGYGDGIGHPSGDNFALGRDKVTFSGLTPGAEYKIVGTITDTAGQTITDTIDSVVTTTPDRITNMVMTPTNITDTEITVNTTFINGQNNEADSSSYTIATVTAPTIPIETLTGSPTTTGTDTVTFTNLTPGAEYKIDGTITDTAGIAATYMMYPITTTTQSPTNMTMTATQTDTKITVNTTFLDGETNKADSSSYTIATVAAPTIPIETLTGSPTTTGTDTVTFGASSIDLIAGTEYVIIGTITDIAGGTTTDTINSIFTMDVSPTNMTMIPTQIDSTIKVDITFLDGTTNKANSSSYTIATVAAPTIPIETLTGSPTTTGTDTVTFGASSIDLIAGTEYVIIGTITDTASMTITDTIESITFLEVNATSMDIVLGDVTETEVTITNS